LIGAVSHKFLFLHVKGLNYSPFFKD